MKIISWSKYSGAHTTYNVVWESYGPLLGGLPSSKLHHMPIYAYMYMVDPT